ncbi:ribose transport system ATP-binding protein [Gibbsiella quercinecans]|uniref:D-ribose transporter ATP-binding protein n=1 Tax=Gibbsiella quercinecans TaxID=929813 RepID=A0A250AZB1_9GAMM|nr:sugar ABC transporter ATP-binding protein [Gibbsiella quercinecans]ATA19191.1 D-ribose transporter ATP-binding protein [Gibbsiella quercinecans]RLM06302.1 D-xylose ABC transporter ATP-binding protein [Gibbsiella quercinecans]RLM11012.1 D-xylose ABC transporter ATP-binding protein [Gibbsiella quercinecans]TCT87703.1 ribose transport system ATP-binding protein [Gibbsiella quercinecans]
MAEKSSPPLLRLDGISKRYGATLALNNVRFDLYAGEVHALMGENGAGKSTLMKILSGNEQRDSGHIFKNGQEIEIRDPRDARKYGIAIIHQELNTVPDMTVAENLFLGQEPTSFAGILDRKKMYQEAKKKLERINADIDPGLPLGSLSIGRQQMVEIARAVSENAKVLVLDEPTAALSRAETLELYRLIEQMRRDGVGMVYISHRMEEVWQLANRVTVFRDGTYIGTEKMGDISTTDVVRMMVGRQIVDLYQHAPRTPGEVLLDVQELAGKATGPVSFQVRAGEVVSMSGLVGSGRTEVARLLFGADQRTHGTVRIGEKESHPSDPTAAIADGIGMVTEDRKSQGLFLGHSVEHNIDISSLENFVSAGVVRRKTVRSAVLEQMQKLRLRKNAVDLPVSALSGGNQQKAALARWLLRDSRLLILDEPTRGVDIGAKREIYELIDKLARAGKAILVISSDLPEAIGISDRLLVMRAGRIVHELPSSSATEEQVMLHATGTFVSKSGECHEQ